MDKSRGIIVVLHGRAIGYLVDERVPGIGCARIGYPLGNEKLPYR